MLYGGISGEERDEAFFVLQELSTVLKYLASEIDAALENDGEVNADRLSKISQALSSSHRTLVSLSESPECSQIPLDRIEGDRHG
jgi:hypothetical protein